MPSSEPDMDLGIWGWIRSGAIVGLEVRAADESLAIVDFGVWSWSFITQSELVFVIRDES